jgi:hypothetical protein
MFHTPDFKHSIHDKIVIPTLANKHRNVRDSTLFTIPIFRVSNAWGLYDPQVLSRDLQICLISDSSPINELQSFKSGGYQVNVMHSGLLNL